MNISNQYRLASNCCMGEIGNYGYAFVPGGKSGIVIMDKKTKAILETMDLGNDENGLKRLDLLKKTGLIVEKERVIKVDHTFSCLSNSLGVWLHVTNACNLNCPYCYIKKSNASMTVVTAQLFLRKLVQTVKKHSLKSVAIRFAGGEPTLNPEVVRLITEGVKNNFERNGIKTELVLITNGTLLDQKWIKFLIENNFRVCISLDGVESDHDKTRSFLDGRGSYETVLRSIDLCKTAGIPLTALSTITEDNIDSIEKLGYFCIEKELSFRFGIYKDIRGDYEGYNAFIGRLSKKLTNFYDYCESAIIKRHKTILHQLADIKINRNRHFRCCGIGHSSITVNFDGRIYLCQSRINLNFIIGSISDDSSMVELLGKQTAMIGLKKLGVLDYKDCNNCQWALVCAGGCPIVTLDTYGSFTNPSPYCSLFKMIIPKLIRLKAAGLICKMLNKGGGTYA